MQRPGKATELMRLAIALIAFAIAIVWLVHRGKRAQEILDSMAYSLAGLVVGAVVAYLLWKMTDSPELHDMFGAAETRRIKQRGYHKAGLVFRLELREHQLDLDISAIIVPLNKEGIECRAMRLGGKPEWATAVEREVWQLGNQQPIEDPRNEKDWPTKELKTRTLESYGYTCKLKDGVTEFRDDHIFVTATDGARIEAILPSSYQFDVTRASVSQEVFSTSRAGSNSVTHVWCSGEPLPEGSSFVWRIRSKS